MPCGTSISIVGSGGTYWTLTIDDNGVATATQSTTPTADFFLADLGNYSGWKITINSSGQIQADQVAKANYPSRAQLVSASGYVYYIAILSSGILVIISGDNAPPVVTGQLFPPRTGAYPPAVQPGGPGTPVTAPVQTTNELGLWFAGCGHSFNHWMVSFTSWAGVCGNSALMACPLCGYVQRILTPASLVYAPENDILFA